MNNLGIGGFQKGHVPIHKGLKFPEWSGENSPRWKGGLPKCADCKKQLSRYDAKYCKKCKAKGSRNYNYVGTKEADELFRVSFEYKQWRIAVMQRDDYRCFDCGQRGGDLNVHHIFSFKVYSRLRLDMNNGITLCVKCHKNYK